MFRLVNEDPTRKYVWVNQLDPMARATYAMQGYIQECYTDGGVYPLMVSNPKKLAGQEIVHQMGMLLWSIDRNESLRIEEEGIDGYGGQVLGDAHARRMLPGGRDAELKAISDKGRLYVDFKTGDESSERTESVGG
jgi:hypothetical protein